MTFNTDNIRELLNQERGLAASNRYNVVLPPINGTPKPGGGVATYNGNLADLSTLCTSANIPGKSILTVDRQIGIEPIKVGVGHTLPDVSLTFYLTGTFSAKKYWQEWIETIVSRVPPYTAGYHTDYAKDVSIEQLDKIGDKIYGVKLIKAYPTNMSEIQLNNQAQGAALELTVTLSYSNYLIT